MSLAPSPAVVRAGTLLAYLAAHPTRAFTVSELARHVGIPRATCDSLLLGLAEQGLVRRDDARRYGLGPFCLVVGDAARVANPALRAASVHAEALARRTSTVVAVSTRDGDMTRLANVFDFGPPFGLRVRAGEAMRLVPPFGASFLAWDDEATVDAWLGRAEPPLTADEVRRYRAALEAVRRRGYSITVAGPRQAELADALMRLAGDPEADDAVRARDEAIRVMAHSEYLAAEVDPEGTARLIQVSAPVFQADGAVTASLMQLGPSHEVTADEIAARGGLVCDAAATATRDIGGSPRRLLGMQP